MIRDYFAIARPEHWIKNIFMLLGAMLAFLLHLIILDFEFIRTLAVGVIATCLLASSNYVINEILDAVQDKEHPLKKSRPMVRGSVSRRGAFVEWLCLGVVGMIVAEQVNKPFVIVSKWHPELILSVPFFMVLMGYIIKLTFEPHSIVQHPERLFHRPLFVLYLIFCFTLLCGLSQVTFPAIKQALGLQGRLW